MDREIDFQKKTYRKMDQGIVLVVHHEAKRRRSRIDAKRERFNVPEARGERRSAGEP